MGFCAFICKCMFEPVHVITLLVVGAIMGATTFCTGKCPMNRSLCALEQEPKFDGLDHFRIKGLTLVLQLYSLENLLQTIESIERVAQTRIIAFDKYPLIHFILQCAAYAGRRFSSSGTVQSIDQFTRKVGNVWQLFGNNFLPQLPYIQVEIVFAVYATSLFDLLNHTA